MRHARPIAKAGTNRFTWDLRYPGATVFEWMILWSARAEAGPLAPPGNYQVRLTADGRTQTQSFAIKRDPRLTNVTDADLAEQFSLAMKVRDKTSEANQIAALRRSIETGDGRPTAQSYVVFKELSAQLDALQAKVNEIVAKDLALLNKTLADRKLDPIRTLGKPGAANGGSTTK